MTADNAAPGLDSLAKAFGLAVLSNDKPDLTPNGTANGVAKQTPDATTANGDTSASGHAKVDSSVPPAVPAAPPGSLNTTKHIYADKEDDQGRYTWVDKYPEHWEEAAENEETAKHALVVRNEKDFDSRKKHKIHSIIVQSPWLKVALAEILKDYPGVTCELKRLVFEAPFEPFVHRWGDLLKFMKKREEKHAEEEYGAEKTREHVELLHGILKEELKDTIRAFEDYVANGVITYQHLWTIFQPGSVVVSRHSGTLSAYEFSRGNFVKTRCGNAYHLDLECIDWGGENFGRGNESVDLYEFKGTKTITTLCAFPLTFHPEKRSVRQTLIARGKKFEQLAGYHYKAYKGVAIGWDNEGEEVRVNVSGRVVIDTHSFNRFSQCPVRYLEDLRASDVASVPEQHADDQPTAGAGDDFLINKRRATVRLGEAQQLICQSRLCGYSLKAKKWLNFFVDLVSEISWNDAAFDSLVLPSDQKDLVMSFAEAQVQNRQTFDDVIEGKGKGIIMLLSGPPGVGKTLTAESVAENMHVPLYMMSAGNLGQRPSDIEYHLAQVLDMVEKWNAVLLLDECDVFLEARSTSDLERNRVVSIFLQMLEYYQGILFLTTNRIDNIDAAFQSRIHVSIAYPNLTSSARRSIWKNFLKKSTLPYMMEEKDYDELAQVELNGRQIKNVLKTSQLLAMKRGGRLRRELIDTVLAIEGRRPQVSEST